MNKAELLCEIDSRMMYEFSRRSLSRASASLFSPAHFPPLSVYLDRNVQKEVDKDRLVIAVAARAYEAGKPACDLDLEDLFEKTKDVDRVFLESLKIPFVTLSVRYGNFADIRLRRIWRIAQAVYGLLANWPDEASFDEVVRRTYTGTSFKSAVSEILRLYSLETRMLSTSLRLFGPLSLALDAFAGAVFEAMEAVTEELCDSYEKKLFGDKTIHA